MAKLNLKSIFTNEQSYTVLQLLWKYANEIDAWNLTNAEFTDYKPSGYITYKLITYPGEKVAVDYATLASHADTASHAEETTTFAPEREYKCKWYHTKLTGDKAPVLNHPESELWIYLKDDSTDDSDPVRYWNYIIKIGNLTNYLSKNIASGQYQGKTGVILRDSFENLILEAVGSVVPNTFANSGIFVRASSISVTDTKLNRPTFMNDSMATAQIKGIAFDESFIDYANGGWSLNGDNNYLFPNILTITGTAWCDNKQA